MTYVVACDNRYDNEILFLKNNKNKNAKSHWTKFIKSATIFKTYTNALRIASQYKYNNTRVIGIEEKSNINQIHIF
mgnify:CR=1 FL=1